MKIIMRRDSVILFSKNNRIDSAKGDVFLIKEFNQERVLHINYTSFIFRWQPVFTENSNSARSSSIDGIFPI